MLCKPERRKLHTQSWSQRFPYADNCPDRLPRLSSDFSRYGAEEHQTLPNSLVFLDVHHRPSFCAQVELTLRIALG